LLLQQPRIATAYSDDARSAARRETVELVHENPLGCAGCTPVAGSQLPVFAGKKIPPAMARQSFSGQTFSQIPGGAAMVKSQRC